MNMKCILRFAGVALAIAVIASAGGSALAQSYPNKPIRFVVGYTVGGGGDIVARIVAQKLSQNLGQQVIVDNRPGGGGGLGAEMVAKAAPDGYTLYEATIGTHGINPSLY